MHRSTLQNPRWMPPFALAACLWTAMNGNADEILVPGDQPTIQAGINAAVNGDEVVLADDTYTGAGNVNCTFGGRLITVRSVSGNPEACIIDCQDAANTRGFTFNTAETSAAVLSGITIQDGNFAGAGGNGGAIHLVNTSPTFTNCRFISNQANTSGAVFSQATASPTFTDCLFFDNHALGNFAGAVNLTGSGQPGHPVFTNCTFLGNTANGNGGAVLAQAGVQAEFHQCRFGANAAHGEGGAIFSATSSTSLTFVNCLLWMNATDAMGGAASAALSDMQFTNCTFSRNQANGDVPGGAGGAIWGSGATATITMKNCIAWEDTPNEISTSLVSPGQFLVTYSTIQGETPIGPGNVEVDPLFVYPNGLDSIPGTLDDDFTLQGGSPCIDRGENAAAAGVTIDLNGNPRFVDDPATPDTGVGRAPLVDWGCYEFQLQGPPPCLWDFNGDGDVGGADLGELLLNWGTCGNS